jgi:hypothetical protein
MKRFTMTFLAGALLLVCTLPAFAQQSTKPRKFKTTYKIDMFAKADFNSKKIGRIPAGVILEALEETERVGGYVKVTYKNKTGWILKGETERYMDVPEPELVLLTNGYKILGNVYRYFFALRNDGTLPYAEKITLRLFDREGKVVYEKTTDFSDDPIKAGTAGIFYIDTLVEAPHLELEYKDGKIKGSTGKFIERV